MSNYEMFCDFWRFHQKYLPMLMKVGEMTSEIKTSISKDAKRLMKKYEREYLFHMLEDFKIYFSTHTVSSIKKGSPIFDFFRDFWSYQKKYLAEKIHDDAYWDHLIESGKELIKKYPEISGYVQALVLDFICEMERLDQEKKCA